jgi:hypothetical protein
MAVTAALISGGLAAAGAVGSAAINASKSNSGAVQNQDIQYQQLNDARNNAYNQALVQALINQRSVAGQTDSFGSTIRYDPATNQWVSALGPLPQAATTAAMQAGISRNTTDREQAQLANQDAARRATLAGSAADTAQRNLSSFRPMGSDQLVGLLQQQATLAQNNTFRPLVADTLRQFARTGTAAGPVLGQIGKDQATNLRQSLIDAQIKGMTSVNDINQQRRQGLEQSAANTATLANPQFQYAGIAPSGVDNTMAQTVSQRASQAGIAPVYGMAGMNSAIGQEESAAKTAGGSIADPNFGKVAAGSALSDLKTAFGSGGTGSNLVSALVNKYMTSDQTPGTPTNAINESSMNPDEANAALNAQNYMKSLMYSPSGPGGFG